MRQICATAHPSLLRTDQAVACPTQPVHPHCWLSLRVQFVFRTLAPLPRPPPSPLAQCGNEGVLCPELVLQRVNHGTQLCPRGSERINGRAAASRLDFHVRKTCAVRGNDQRRQMIGGVLARTAAAEGVRARSVTGAMQATICSVTLAHAEAASTWLGGNCNGAAWRTSALACARHARAQPDAAPAQHERQQNACASPAAPLKCAAPLPSEVTSGRGKKPLPEVAQKDSKK